jgi:hypothetical protein
MVQRAVDCQVAQEVAVAEELARLGATAALIERLTGFGARWSRNLVRRYDGPMAQKPRDVRYFDADPDRRYHGRLCISRMEAAPSNLSPGTQLIEAYFAYRGMAQHMPNGMLDINDAAQVIELYRAGVARVHKCKCNRKFLTFSQRLLCPVCVLMERSFCKNCHLPLPENARHTTLYCTTCAKSPQRIAMRRRARRNEASSSRIEFGRLRGKDVNVMT